MNEESILKRTLIMTGKLVGIFSIWVALVSVVATLAASRMASALSGGGAEHGALVPADTTKADATKKDEGAAARGKNPPANATTKPNG